MSELSKLARKPKKEKIGDIEIEIMPLGVSDMDLMDKIKKDTPTSEMIKVMKDIIKKSVIGATDEEINAMSLEYMISLQEAIMRANNIDDKDISAKKEELAKIKVEQDAKSA